MKKLLFFPAVALLFGLIACSSDEMLKVDEENVNSSQSQDPVATDSIVPVDTIESEDSLPAIEPPVTQESIGIEIPGAYSLDFSQDEENAREKLQDFALILYNEAAKSQGSAHNGNMVISPISAEMMLAIYINSVGQSVSQKIADLIGVDCSVLNSTCNKIMRLLHFEQPNYSFSIANSLWYQEGLSIAPDYRNLINETFYADVATVDFKDVISSKDIINQWISKKTHGIFENYLSDAYDRGTIAAMINAMYLNSKWITEFNPKETKQMDFYGTDRTSSVDMMHILMYEGLYCSTPRFEATLKGLNGNLAFIAVLPKEGISIDLLSESFSSEDLDKCLNSTYYQVDLNFPKFKIESECDLSAILASLGIDTSVADLSPMGIDMVAPINFRQKTSTTVYEEGVIASSITHVFMGGSMPDQNKKKVSLTFDRPFLYFIRDTKTDAIILAGKVSNL